MPVLPTGKKKRIGMQRIGCGPKTVQVGERSAFSSVHAQRYGVVFCSYPKVPGYTTWMRPLGETISNVSCRNVKLAESDSFFDDPFGNEEIFRGFLCSRYYPYSVFSVDKPVRLINIIEEEIGL